MTFVKIAFRQRLRTRMLNKEPGRIDLVARSYRRR